MIQSILLYFGAFSAILWGTAHLFPTKNVVKGFGEISEDNKNIITMEWIIEGLALIFVGLLIFFTTLEGERKSAIFEIVGISSAAMLFSMAVISFFTGFRVRFLPYRLCPLIFLISGISILFGTLM